MMQVGMGSWNMERVTGSAGECTRRAVEWKGVWSVLEFYWKDGGWRVA